MRAGKQVVQRGKKESYTMDSRIFEKEGVASMELGARKRG